METELWTQFTQFGAAGLMAWMWLSERRAALTRERELSEAHSRLMDQRAQIDALLQAVQNAARAAAALEAGQRAIGAAVDRIADAILTGRARPAPRLAGAPDAHGEGPGTLSA